MKVKKNKPYTELLSAKLTDVEFVVLDVETTGLKNNSYIIDIALVKVKNFVEIDRFNTLVKPLQPINIFIQKLTHITNEMVILAPKFNEIRTFVRYFIGNSVIVGHNVKFDKQMLDLEYTRYDDPPLNNLTVDTLRLAYKIFSKEEKKSLKHLSKLLNIEHKNMHRALGDTLATVELFNVLLGKAIEHFKLETLNDLIKLLQPSKNNSN